MTSRIRSIITFAFIIGLLTFIYCDQLNLKPEPVTYLNNQFSIDKPVGWRLREDLNSDADLQMGSDLNEAYGIVMTENKGDFADMDLAKYSELTREPIWVGLGQGRELEGPESIQTDEYKAIRFKMSGPLDGINVVYWHVSVETDNHFHQMLMWSRKSKFESNKKDFQQVLDSFKEVEQASN